MAWARGTRGSSRAWPVTVAAAAAIVALTATAFAADGDLDPTFNAAGNPPGTAQLPVSEGGSNAYGVALQADGKIVVAGQAVHNNRTQFALVRYNPDGTLDTANDSTPGTSFGTGGIVLTPFGVSANGADAVVIQPDGKIVASGFAIDNFSGTTQRAFALARYNPDGTLDATFNPSGSGSPAGTVITQIDSVGGNSEASGVALQPDGKIVAAGYAATVAQPTANPFFQFAVARYNPDGTLDTNADSTPGSSFNTTGIVKTPVGAGQDSSATRVAVQPDGKIVAGGYAGIAVGTRGFALARYTSAGALDTTTFNPTGSQPGIVLTDFGLPSTRVEAYGLALQADGKIVLVGGAYQFGQPGTTRAVAARYRDDGALDTGFGSGSPAGTTVMSIGPLDQAETLGVAVAPDGTIIAVGDADMGTASKPDVQFLVLKLDALGHPDPGFGTAGMVFTKLSDLGDTQAWGVALQPDGRIVVAGVADNTTGSNFAVVRYRNTVAAPPAGQPGTGAGDGGGNSGGDTGTAAPPTTTCGALTQHPTC